MTSCLHIIARNSRRSCDSVGTRMNLSPWRILKLTHQGAAPGRGRSLMSTIVLLLYVITLGSNADERIEVEELQMWVCVRRCDLLSVQCGHLLLLLQLLLCGGAASLQPGVAVVVDQSTRSVCHGQLPRTRRSKICASHSRVTTPTRLSFVLSTLPE